jgi:hypothetical protein
LQATQVAQGFQQSVATFAGLLRLTGENGAPWLPDPPIQR